MWRAWENDQNEEIYDNNDKKRKHLSSDAKEIIKNVYESLCVNKCENSALKKTSELTKVAYNTVWKIVNSKSSGRKPRRDSGASRIFSEFEKDVIRRTIYGMYEENMLPTIRSLHQKLNDSERDVKCSITTLYKTVRDLGFHYKKVNKRQVIMESRRIREWRYNYLIKIRQYRAENRAIIYLDETWYDSHDIVSKSWQDNSACCSINVPVSRGKRIIILHAGCESGWINNALLLSAKNIKDSALDYHDNMSSDIFEEWFEKKLLPNIPPSSIIVMDNASYHSRQTEKIPNKGSKKSEIIEYLYKEDLFFEETYTKEQLLEVVKSKPSVKKYVCDALAEKYGHYVLRLPPYYCVFNPCELIWSQLKSHVRRNNSSPANSNSVITLLKEEMCKITPDKWSACLRHVISIEDEYLRFNNTYENFIINVSDSTDDDLNSSDTNSEIEVD